MLRSARNPIKCAFGRLKARQSFLDKRVDFQLKFVSRAIMSVLFFTENLAIVQMIKNQLKNRSRSINKDRLTNTNQDTVFSGNLDENEIIRDVILSSVKFAIDYLIQKWDIETLAQVTLLSIHNESKCNESCLTLVNS